MGESMKKPPRGPWGPFWSRGVRWRAWGRGVGEACPHALAAVQRESQGFIVRFQMLAIYCSAANEHLVVGGKWGSPWDVRAMLGETGFCGMPRLPWVRWPRILSLSVCPCR